MFNWLTKYSLYFGRFSQVIHDLGHATGGRFKYFLFGNHNALLLRKPRWSQSDASSQNSSPVKAIPTIAIRVVSRIGRRCTSFPCCTSTAMGRCQAKPPPRHLTCSVRPIKVICLPKAVVGLFLVSLVRHSGIFSLCGICFTQILSVSGPTLPITASNPVPSYTTDTSTLSFNT